MSDVAYLKSALGVHANFPQEVSKNDAKRIHFRTAV